MDGEQPRVGICVIRIEMRTENDRFVTITTTLDVCDPSRSHRDVTTTATAALDIVARFLRDGGVPAKALT